MSCVILLTEKNELGIVMCKLRYIVLLLILMFFTGTIDLMFGTKSAFAGLEVDPISSECLTCHDDTDESKIKFHGGHVTGRPYEDYLDNNQSLRMVSALPLEMILHEGKITCATCHGTDPHDAQLLVIDNRESALCVSCHKI